jgi:hypothetical protein
VDIIYYSLTNEIKLTFSHQCVCMCVRARVVRACVGARVYVCVMNHNVDACFLPLICTCVCSFVQALIMLHLIICKISYILDILVLKSNFAYSCIAR